MLEKLIKQKKDKRITQAVEVLKKFKAGNYQERLIISASKDDMDFLLNEINELGESLSSNGIIKGYESRINEIMEKLLKFTMMDFTVKINISEKGDELDAIALGINTLVEELDAAMQAEVKRVNELQSASEQISRHNWLLKGISQLNDVIRGEKPSVDLAQAIITQLCTYLSSKIGAIYLVENGNQLKFIAGYALSKEIHTPDKLIKFGEGLVGQAAIENKKIVLTNIPNDYIKISTGFGDFLPKEIVITPFKFAEKIKGIIEFGNFENFTQQQFEFLDLVAESIGIALHTSQSSEKLKKLLGETQAQSEELESQQEELKQINEELTQQRNRIQASEEELRVQQEELAQKNIELQEKTVQLEEQNEEVKTKNKELETVKEALTLKAEELALTGKYKSEFLANMSHELRTPLNSILILAKLISENKDRNLTQKQIESANVIYKSGNDLLELINEILDLSKIESGKMSLQFSDVFIHEINDELKGIFNDLASQKNIAFTQNLDSKLPAKIYTDKGRLMQVLKNLLSNAFKFTDRNGLVELTIYPAPQGIQYKSANLKSAKNVIAFSVKDTGIGIPKEKQSIIFEAFQQADSSTSRKYGGTGLGLTISREIISILGGEIQMESKEGIGSTFIAYLPEKGGEKNTEENITIKDLQEKAKEEKPEMGLAKEVNKTVLIMENDEEFSKILQNFAQERKLKTFIATKAQEGLDYAKKYKPDAIIISMSILTPSEVENINKIKEDIELSKIPIHVISSSDKNRLGLKAVKLGYLKKPINVEELNRTFDTVESLIAKKIKKVLLIEDDKIQNDFISELLTKSNISSIQAFTGNEGLNLLEKEIIDCVILDLKLPDISGFDLIEKVKKNPRFTSIPFIIYTGLDLSDEEENRLRKYTDAIIVKTPKSFERLLDEVNLFLRKISDASPQKKDSKEILQSLDDILKNKTILIVDDDIRNIYALTTVLEEKKINCLTANDGIEALKKLGENPKTDLVLMDIMMPNMDGFETMKKIREQNKFKNLPIIALTAKAMKGDREKCIEAGASDYISKPVNIDQLLTLMRVWLYK